jgi:hypothetical protein
MTLIEAKNNIGKRVINKRNSDGVIHVAEIVRIESSQLVVESQMSYGGYLIEKWKAEDCSLYNENEKRY